MFSPNCCFLTWIQVSQEARKVICYSHLFVDCLQFVVIHTVKDFSIVNEAEVCVFLEFHCFFYDPVWSLVPLSFLNQLEHLEVHSSHIVEAWLGEFWASLGYRVRWVQLCGSWSILWHFLSLGLEWKLTFSSSVATAEFSKFADILSAALWQHHLLRSYVA